ncbi:uncharacterized protein LOC131180055 [Hevea brasiliensis]|uniref:uncharacterized protein LOC131180055 n=1 Tax=Hevea brasiliensis TaxID=3981 RepID=UPI0025F737DB|nr:uncharacterized protein LOC131180055 [Hevea brasiliensis]
MRLAIGAHLHDQYSSSSQALVSSTNSVIFSLSTPPNVAKFISVKLNSSNYVLWKAQLVPLLHGYNLSRYISDTATPPSQFLEDNKPNPEYDLWTLADQLAALQAPVSDETLVNDILEGLGSEYRPFIRAIEARNVPIEYDDLYALLLTEETQLKMEALVVSSSIPPSAHVATKTPHQHGGRSQVRGHSNKPPYGTNSSSTAQVSPNIVCHNCRGHGHIVR